MEDRQRKLETVVALKNMTIERGCTAGEAANAQERLKLLCRLYRFTKKELSSGQAEDMCANKTASDAAKSSHANRYRTGRMWRPSGFDPMPIEKMDDNHLMNAFLLLSERLMDPAFGHKHADYEMRLKWLVDEAARRGLSFS